jgi:branched-chain amino acid transport system substrate-binding protein
MQENSDGIARRPGISRRRLLEAGAAGTLAVAAAPLLSACGSSAAAAKDGAKPTGAGKELLSILGLTEGKVAGGISMPIGASLALSGAGSYYGQVMGNGMNLAVEHIRQAGGPVLTVVAKDNQSGNPQAGVTSGRDFGAAGVHICQSSFTADLGAMLPEIAQYKILTLDGGGGTGNYAQRKPYFWGTIALTPDDTFDGVTTYLKQQMPSVKRVGAIGQNLGTYESLTVNHLSMALAAAGITDLGYQEMPLPTGNTDFSAQLAVLANKRPDLVFAVLYGTDPGYFMKQYATSGIGKPVIGFNYTPDSAKIAGAAFNGYMFAFDYFDYLAPPNPLSKFFVREYQAKYKTTYVDPYAANFYEDALTFWELIRRVKAKGGDATDPTALQEALVANPTFPSVYGGTATSVGSYSFNLTSHSVAKRGLGLYQYQYQSGTIKTLATFNLGGADFRLA